MKITIRNEFTNRSTKVDSSRPMTAKRALTISRRLCADDCQSGDHLGARGPQDNPDEYRRLTDRAAQAILTGQ
jgi:hypothetical protein